MRRARARAMVGLAALAACGRPGADSGAGTDAGPASTSSAGAAPGAGASAHGSATATAWKGAYKSAESGITLPADVKWRVPENPSGVGDGTLAITIDPMTGRVRGTLDGVLGPATVDGLVADGRLTAAVRRKDPSDHGFTGTLAGALGDGGARGTLHLTLAEASAVRQATFELAPEPSP